MKAPVLSLVLVVSAAPFAIAEEVRTGATPAEVREVLGQPKGRVELGDRQMLYYDRGEIELRDGRVIRAALRTAAEQAALEARDERVRAEQAARQGRLVAEGTALRDRKLADASFLAAPAAYQAAFWENFARSYPGVPCVEPLTIARLKLAEQREEQNRASAHLERLAVLEERFAAAAAAPVHYRVGYPVYRSRYERQQEFALWPVSYTYYDAPRPIYTTPETPLVSPFTRDLAQPEYRDYRSSERERWQGDKSSERRGHPGWRGAESGRGSRRDRM
ncbi:hypothetical protein Verru16b_00270 [Lacunisphaera limnophila]|uniref:Uncharacterized protein n=1 Tax=Lacunisphaera limnophila TaxID=1838286 RepID=A0A1I7PHX8_9BACT|nr:hypothetical protein [Lacunisphaera limnophila]AOS43227.1 hypothetical protein Verru16b_00270 [Lacunisphaera limnophila]